MKGQLLSLNEHVMDGALMRKIVEERLKEPEITVQYRVGVFQV